MSGKKSAAKRRLDNMSVKVSTSIVEALKCMDEAGGKIIFVVEADGRLAGVASDGDIRRWILSGGALDRPVSEAMNPRPISLPQGHTVDEARSALLDNRIECVPIVDASCRLASAIWWVELFEEAPEAPEQIDLPVVVMAGGPGTRLAPVTKVLPKPLIPIGETPILELIIEKFVASGCSRFLLTVSYKSNLIKAYFADIAHDYEIEYVHEEVPLGTAGGLRLLRGLIDKTFFVSNCDILVELDHADVLRFHRENGNKITLVASMKQFTIPYGVCDISDGGRLSAIREKPDYNHLVSTGLYVLEPDIIDEVPEGRYDMTDLIEAMIERGENVGVYPVSEKSWFDMGQWEEYQQMLARFGAM